MYTLTFGIYKFRDPDTGLYVSKCLELGTESCGVTLEQALENIREATSLELDTFETSTEIVKYLEEHGVRVLTVGDALRERDRIVKKFNLDVDILATPEHFTREMALA